MLTELYFSNFKCFKEEKHFPLSSINLFTGLNGRGKSSVLQIILLMSQTAINTNSLKELLISSSWLKLGNFDDIKSTIPPNHDGLSLGFKSDLEKLNSFEFEYKEKVGAFDKGILTEFVLNGEKSSAETLSASNNIEKEKASNRVINYQDDTRILKIFRNVHYVSADREGPRLYVDKYGMPDIQKTGLHGEHAIKILTSYNEELNSELFFEKKPNNLLELCEQWMSYIFDGALMNINDNKENNVLSLGINPRKENSFYKTVNVGFGYSYILSLVISCLIAKKDDIVIFENPEAHLHPRAQSRLTQLFTKLALNGIQVFIESHSEHILNGFRVAIADKKETFSVKDLSVYYFDENFEVSRMNLQPDGFIENWPTGFFDQNELDMSLMFRYSREK